MDKPSASTNGRVNSASSRPATVKVADRARWEAAWADYFRRNPTIIASYRKASGDWPPDYGTIPGCATCRRHNCKDAECGWLGYRRPDESDKPCPRCGSECHVLMTQHRAGLCRMATPPKRKGNYKGRPRRNVG